MQDSMELAGIEPAAGGLGGVRQHQLSPDRPAERPEWW